MTNAAKNAENGSAISADPAQDPSLIDPCAGPAAINTLRGLRYTYHGGVLWKPPLGQPPKFMSDTLNAENRAETVLMPRRLTAENGAKAALSGEFSEKITHYCTSCDHDAPDEGCEECNGRGSFLVDVPVEWDTIKRIYKAAIELLATTQAGDQAKTAALPPIELAGVSDQEGGMWRTCSGCHESNEGHPTGPFSAHFKCTLGNGCDECGGIGAVWDTTDYEDMARYIESEECSDDLAVDRFASAMREKLAQARAKGRSGWQQCDPVELSLMLREHVEKGDPRDVANFCMFLWSLGKPISDACLPMGRRATESKATPRLNFDDPLGRACAFGRAMSATQPAAAEVRSEVPAADLYQQGIAEGLEDAARCWDGCIYHGVGEDIDIGAAIRARKQIPSKPQEGGAG